MKSLVTIFYASTMLVGCSSSEETSDYSCYCSAPFIKTVTNIRGEIRYDDVFKSWYIFTNLDGDLYPEIHNGLIKIDKKLKKEGTAVVFTGDVYNMYIDNLRNSINMDPCKFCLDLLDITALDDFIDFEKIVSFCQITWRLQGYGNSSDWHSVEGKNNGDFFMIAFREDLIYRGQGIANRFGSNYLYRKDGFFVQSGFFLHTAYEEKDEDASFFEQNLPKANKMEFDNQGFLKLYYSDQDYFYFKNEGKSKD